MSEATTELRKYAHETMADMGEDYPAALRAMRDELGEVARETGLDEERIRLWIVDELAATE